VLLSQSNADILCAVLLITEEVCGGRVRCMTYTATATAAAVSDTDTAADVSSSRCNGQLVTATSNGRVHVWALNWSEPSLAIAAAAGTAATAETDETSEQAVLPICTITVAATKTVLGEPRCVASVL
jgi:hypothetical protein